jgi:CheY-like chemotaxis protein
VQDGAEALELISCTGRHRAQRSTQPKVVVLDLKLPKVDGLEVLRRLKSDPQSRDIPIVVFSSSQEERDLIACYKLGANSFVVKPMAFDQFSKSVRQLCEYWLGLNQTPKA